MTGSEDWIVVAGTEYLETLNKTKGYIISVSITYVYEALLSINAKSVITQAVHSSAAIIRKVYTWNEKSLP